MPPLEADVPKRQDIRKVMIIGSGPIVIGQACEFDYSGTQACKALRRLGYEIVLVNTNPATIMTDPSMADVTYIEPLNVERMAEIIDKERPDALLPNLGGQTGLNLSSALARRGVLAKYGVQVIGVPVDAIERGEDRQVFKDTMNRLGIDMPRSEIAHSVEEAEQIAQRIGLPAVVRPAYTMGGTGGGLVYNLDELRTVTARGLAASMIGQVLIEESVEGWEELELEVVRDAKNQMITVCFIENVDAMGVHTGDSYCVAPMLTIAPELQQRLQKHSYDIVESIGVIGGTNIQFAHDPKTGRVLAIEINPRTSRSSALASKATGFPIAYVSSLLAGGLTMDEIPYWRDGTLEKYTPWGDYVVVKFCRWAFEKFAGLQDRLGTQMLAVGEVMSIGKTYKEAFQKSIRSLEIGRYGLGCAKDFQRKSLDELLAMLAQPTSERQFLMYEALRKGADVQTLYDKTHIKPWFIEQMRELVEEEEEILRYQGQPLPDELLTRAKKDGFSDRYLARLLGVDRAGDPPAAEIAGVGAGLPPGPRQRRGERRLLLLQLQRARRDHGLRSPQGDGPGRRPQPHRAGDRVRLLLRPRRVCPPRRGARIDHGQLQPGDGFDRLRHGQQAVLRAADGRGHPGDLREGAAGGRDRPVRRPDAAEHRRRVGRRGRPHPGHLAGYHRPGRGPGPVPPDDAQAGHPGAGIGHGQHAGRGPGHRRTGSATR